MDPEKIESPSSSSSSVNAVPASPPTLATAATTTSCVCRPSSLLTSPHQYYGREGGECLSCKILKSELDWTMDELQVHRHHFLLQKGELEKSRVENERLTKALRGTRRHAGSICNGGGGCGEDYRKLHEAWRLMVHQHLTRLSAFVRAESQPLAEALHSNDMLLFRTTPTNERALLPPPPQQRQVQQPQATPPPPPPPPQQLYQLQPEPQQPQLAPPPPPQQLYQLQPEPQQPSPQQQQQQDQEAHRLLRHYRKQSHPQQKK